MRVGNMRCQRLSSRFSNCGDRVGAKWCSHIKAHTSLTIQKSLLSTIYYTILELTVIQRLVLVTNRNKLNILPCVIAFGLH